MAHPQQNNLIEFEKLDTNIQDLIKLAISARKLAYIPYSKFAVGAALRTSDDYVYSGCNIESKVFSPTICAERTAICKAVSEGHKQVKEIAVVAHQDECFTTPCGVCREVLSEFGGNSLDVYMTKPEDTKLVLHMKLSELLPMAFESCF